MRISKAISFFRTVAFTSLLSTCLQPAATAAEKPVLLYSRYFNAQGENRYEADGNFSDVIKRLNAHFTVRVDRRALTPETLRDVRVVLIANPSDRAAGSNPPPPHVSAADIENIRNFVARGGGLIVMENQEAHNLEVEAMNRLLGEFGIQATNIYTDAKLLSIPKETPVMGGLKWAYYTGNSLRIAEGHPVKPRALVTNDLRQRPAKGTRDEPGILLAIAEPQKGKVAVVTDCGWVTNAALRDEGIGGVVLKEHDNWEMFRRLCFWAAQMPSPK